jgi:hypothetical protein
LRALTKKSVSLKKKKAILQIKNQLHELIWLKYYSRIEMLTFVRI